VACLHPAPAAGLHCGRPPRPAVDQPRRPACTRPQRSGSIAAGGRTTRSTRRPACTRPQRPGSIAATGGLPAAASSACPCTRPQRPGSIAARITRRLISCSARTCTRPQRPGSIAAMPPPGRSRSGRSILHPAPAAGLHCGTVSAMSAPESGRPPAPGPSGRAPLRQPDQQPDGGRAEGPCTRPQRPGSIAAPDHAAHPSAPACPCTRPQRPGSIAATGGPWPPA